jgi:two-component system CheB/CheR fusion protein
MTRPQKGPRAPENADTDAPPSIQTRPCLIVGMGASAGGLNAFKTFFSRMPVDTCMAFVLVPHLDPTHQSLMHELLGRQTGMPVCEAEHGMTVERNHVYIIPPARDLTISEGVLQLSTPREPRGAQTAIDRFLRSLAEDQEEHAVGIILSGTGSHGALGLKEIKLAGGLVMVQQPESAEYDQMPRSAIATGLVDYVLPPEQMPQELVKYGNHPYLQHPSPAETADKEIPEYFNRILALLQTRAHHDFRSYRKSMLVRRVQRRMGLCHIDAFPDYLDYLRKHADEVTALYKDLLIGVTGFFREPGAFKVLAERIIPELVARSGATPGRERPLRVWVPGCATGEEAYSLAILLHEQFDTVKKPANIQIFASDIDEESLAIARQGIYPASIASDISPKRLQRYFLRIDEDHYQVSKSLREYIVFAEQSLISDAPYSKLDLVSCRNLLIYLEPEFQQKVISLFHFALNENSCLLLGPAESIGPAADMFEPVSKRWRVYRRIGPVRPERVSIPITTTGESRGEPPAREPAAQRRVDFSGLMQRLVLEEYAPASVLVTRTYEILSFMGPAVNYLAFPPGEPTVDLISLARPGLHTRIRAACRKAIQEGQPVKDAEARVKRNGSYVPCSINVRALTEPKEAEGLLLVTFQDRPFQAARSGGEQAETASPEDAELVRQLEYQLKATHEDLQGTIEEMESSNEELKASNEEVMSMNEELQSTNEELETSKEELQSLNEELSTLNQQLQEKVDELERANNDITNLLTSSEVATVFLDTELCIKRFTPPTAKLLNLQNGDVGRSFSDFSMKFHDPTLLEDCRRVLQTLKTVEQEVHTDEARSYLRRILPYRTLDNRIDGVVIMFIEITDRVAAESRSRLLATILRDSNDAITVQELDGRITTWNRGAERMYGYSEAEALGMNIRNIVPPDRVAEVLELVKRIAAGEDIRPFETERLTRDGRRLDVSLTLTRVNDVAGRAVALSTTERDITAGKCAAEELRQLNEHLERRIAERTAELQRSEQEFHALADNVPALFSYLDAEQRYRYVNRRYEEHWRRPAAEIVGKTAEELLGPDNFAFARPHVEAVLAGRPATYEAKFEFADAPHTMQVHLVPDIRPNGRVQGFFTLVNDISELKQAESAIRVREERLRIVLETAPDAILTIGGDGKILAFNQAAEAIFGYSAREAIGQHLRLLMLPPHREEQRGSLLRSLETRDSTRFGQRREILGRRKDGSTFPAELSVSQIDEQGLFVGIARDLSAQRALEREVISASTAEQERIGQELHDGLGQRLTGLSMIVETLRQGLKRQRLPEAAMAGEILEQLQEAMRETRAIARGLIPIPVTEQGLSDALGKLAEDTQAATGISCRFTEGASDSAAVKDRAVAMQLYRIAQEMVHNAVRHAQARHITIRLSKADHRIELSVRDDGKGFQPDSGEGEGEGYGLRIMRYRAAMIGCEFKVDSAPGKGTVVRCMFSSALANV